jgi:hypothetical protein
VELEHLKIETRLIDEKFANAMGEYVTEIAPALSGSSPIIRVKIPSRSSYRFCFTARENASLEDKVEW